MRKDPQYPYCRNLWRSDGSYTWGTLLWELTSWLASGRACQCGVLFASGCIKVGNDLRRDHAWVYRANACGTETGILSVWRIIHLWYDFASLSQSPCTLRWWRRAFRRFLQTDAQLEVASQTGQHPHARAYFGGSSSSIPRDGTKGRLSRGDRMVKSWRREVRECHRLSETRAIRSDRQWCNARRESRGTEV